MSLAVGLGAWDWAFMLWFLGVTLGVGLVYARRAGKDLGEYFVSGRSLPWWALGTSMVATTFAADTPIVVAGFVIEGGIAKNWVWWSFGIGGTLTVFVFSRMWRRAAVTTEIELLAVRYEGEPARWLRGFKAIYLGIVLNSIVIGWVTTAMGTIVERVFDVPKVLSLGCLFALALGYTAVSGLWGVVAADVLQFAMAMIGALLLATLCVHEVGGLGALVERVQGLEAEYDCELLSVFPTDWQSGFAAAVMVLALVNWWAVLYPGAEPGGGGYIAQRMLAARDERHARLGTLWFVFAHYVLRPWPWIVIALCAVVLQPEFLAYQAAGEAERAAMPDFAAEKAYPAMFELLPVGLLGLVVASFLAAFLSTITTQVNLAASYLVTDLYLPFFAKPGESEHTRVRVARGAVVLVTVIGAFVAWVLESAGQGWTVVWNATAGMGLVLIARWLWWRVNAWSEIAAIAASSLAFAFLWLTEPGEALVARVSGDEAAFFDSARLLLAVGFSTLVWVAATMLTQPVSMARLRAFYLQVKPGGFWGPVARAAAVEPFTMKRDLGLWVAATAMLFGGLFGLGAALLGNGATAALWLALAATGGFVVWRGLRVD